MSKWDIALNYIETHKQDKNLYDSMSKDNKEVYINWIMDSRRFQFYLIAYRLLERFKKQRL